MTRTRILKWRGELGLVLPRSVVSSLGLRAGDRLDLDLQHGGIRIQPVDQVNPNLESLLRRVTNRNRHSAIDELPRGRKIW